MKTRSILSIACCSLLLLAACKGKTWNSTTDSSVVSTTSTDSTKSDIVTQTVKPKGRVPA